MARASFQVGQMVRSAHSCHNQESYYMLSTMPTTTESLPFSPLTTARESFPVVKKVRFVSGRLAVRLRLWRPRSKSIVVALMKLRSTRTTLKLYHHHTMVHASFGISLHTLVSCASSNRQCSSQLFTTPTSLNLSQPVPIERLLTGTASMVKLSVC